MDDEKIPKKIRNYILFLILALIIQSFLFLQFNKEGIILLTGIIAFMFVFSSKNKQLNKKHEKNILVQRNWFISKYKLTKEIP